MNQLQPLYDGFNSGDPADKLAALPKFPLMVDIEVTSACNFRCLMCPTGNLSLKRPAGFMEKATFDHIVEQCGEHGTAIRFIGWGEPLLHPDIVRFVLMATKAGCLTHINTNGSRLDANLAEWLVTAGLSSIKFSFQGVDRDSYREMRNTDFFDGMIEAIRLMRRARSLHSSAGAMPWIAASTSVTDESPERIEAFKKRIGPLVDQLSIGHTTFDYLDTKAVRLSDAERATLERLMGLQSVEKKHPVPCPEVYGKLSIHYNGSVAVCCNAYDKTGEFGNVNQTPLKELWRHKFIEDYRRRLARKEYTGPLCGQCWDYMSLTVGDVGT